MSINNNLIQNATNDLQTYLQTPPASSTSSPAPTNPTTLAYQNLQNLRESLDPHYLFLRSFVEIIATKTSSVETTGGDNIEVIKMTPQEEEITFHCITGIRHTTLYNWRNLPLAYKVALRNYILHISLFPIKQKWVLSKTVRNACLSTFASFTKRDWIVSLQEGNEDHKKGVEEKEELRANLTQLITSHTHHLFSNSSFSNNMSNPRELYVFLSSCLQAPFTSNPENQKVAVYTATQTSTFLSILIGEFTGGSTASSYNESLEFHRTSYNIFERGIGEEEGAFVGLNESLRLCITSLGAFISFLASSHSHAMNNGGSLEYTDLGTAVISATTDVLSWEFNTQGHHWDFSSSTPASNTSSKTAVLVRPPQSWSQILIRPDFLSAIFQLYSTSKDTCNKMAHSIRQLILQLSSITGDVIYQNSKELKLGYASFLVEGTLSIISTMMEQKNKENGDGVWSSLECMDVCSILSRLVMNYRVSILSQLQSTSSTATATSSQSLFENVCIALRTIGTNLIETNYKELQKVYGDVESLDDTTLDRRENAFTQIMEGIVLLVEDPWLIIPSSYPGSYHQKSSRSSEEDERRKWVSSSMSNSLSPLYNTYVTCRVESAKLEEHYITSHLEELDEIREEITASNLEEEMTSASSLGRLNVSSSMNNCLSHLFGRCLPRLRELFEASADQATLNSAIGGGGGHVEVTPDAAALLEEARLLVVCACHLLTDDNEGETPTVPDKIVQSTVPNVAPHSEATTASVVGLVNSLMSLAEFQASRIAVSSSDPRLSPLLAKTLLWFFHRWAPAYILPNLTDYDGGNGSGILSSWSTEESSQQAVSFCVTLCLHYHCYWPQEKQVQEGAASLLLALSKRGKVVRTLLTRCASFEKIARLHVATAGLRHNASESEIVAAVSSTADGFGSTIPADMVRGYQRMPYVDRAKVLTALLVGASESEDAKGTAIVGGCLSAVETAFSGLVQALSNKQIHAIDVNAQEMACLCVEMYGGIARVSEMSDSERIPQFLTPSLNPLSGLMNFYAQDLSVCEGLLRFFRDYAELFVTMLTRDQCLALFSASAELLKGYSSHHCSSRVVKHSLKSSEQVDFEEEQSYSDVLCALQLLIHLGTKDFIDVCSAEGAGQVESSQVTDVIFFGLQQILPLMTSGLLQFPTLCTQYFSLVGFMMDTYPEKVCTLPFDLFNALLDSLLFGMSHTDTFVAKSSLVGIGGLAREHLKSQALAGHLAVHNGIFDNCARRLLQEVVFQGIIWDRLEPAGFALLPLVAVDVNKFASSVNEMSQHLGSVEKQERLQVAFQRLIKPEVINKVASGGYEGRMNRLKFKKDFEEFVRDVHSFLVTK